MALARSSHSCLSGNERIPPVLRGSSYSLVAVYAVRCLAKVSVPLEKESERNSFLLFTFSVRNRRRDAIISAMRGVLKESLKRFRDMLHRITEPQGQMVFGIIIV